MFSWTGSAGAQGAKDVKLPTPIAAVGGIIDAFHSHEVVGLSAGADHGDARGPAFVVSLIRDPRFRATTIDVVIENANARYQHVMDRFASGGTVPYDELRHVWDDTTQPQAISGLLGLAGEVPETYRALREINVSLPRDRQHRAILGDPPIDWDSVRSRDDFQKWLALRDTGPAEVIRREVLSRSRRALVVYGSGHLQRKQQATNYQMNDPRAQTVVSLLDHDGVSTFVVVAIGDRFGSSPATDAWPVPSLALISGTAFGKEPVPEGSLPRVAVRHGALVPIPRDEWVTLPLEEQFDALLYLGPASSRTAIPLPRAICDPGYLKTRLERMTLAGIPQSSLDRLTQFCAK